MEFVCSKEEIQKRPGDNISETREKMLLGIKWDFYTRIE